LRECSIALGLLGDKALVPELVDRLAAAEALSSQAALASALGWIGDARSVDPLVELVVDPTRTGLSRAFATVALGIVCDEAPLPWNTDLGANVHYAAHAPSLSDPLAANGILDIF
jgi:HEAT repeat protein